MFIKQNFINGQWIASEDVIAIKNPATKAIIGEVSNGGHTEAVLAIEAASKAFALWSKKTARYRSQLLYQWYQLIKENQDELARIITIEQGKPLKEALAEIEYANEYVLWYAEEAKRNYGNTIPASTTNKHIIVKKEPVGVVAAITPWNFPAAMITRKLAPALAAGCTVVVKPSEETPFTALKLIQLAEKANFPRGVINIVTGNAKQIGDAWLRDKRVRKLSFTGSTPVGKLLMKEAADSVKKLSLELGGHAPFIVTAQADIDRAVEGAIQSKFRNAGQACVASNRFYIHEDVIENFTARLVERTSRLTLGNGLKNNIDIGPLINENAIAKVMYHIEDAVAKGASILTGGKKISEEKGHYFQPTVVGNVTDDMVCMQDETFGPLAPITSFKTIEEVVNRANSSQYGLAAYVFTTSLDEATFFMNNLEYGVIGVNDGLPSAAQAPFGGYKESGLGREGGYFGIEEYLEQKYISVDSFTQ
ncbi:NAD-dependent succinate-semialdehyde dehydrogenase [Cytobacillus sp. IB215316]|uniref:NAD-dependent succinate-semialdehyde dehydrogenase n=1 Tax=Cytobacillus sp. IB215316 TaxID=3097354 RepID=UPI002A13817A|nr:NAD-dependent succinate-semialdehyde dehydrogenase [Cytobacillus sp. IB215316]MDX8360648.1 NAD-dependent succinate-semialdehyde dehydrogenase [Cytobacillus sp. IB215316]